MSDPTATMPGLQLCKYIDLQCCNYSVLQLYISSVVDCSSCTTLHYGSSTVLKCSCTVLKHSCAVVQFYINIVLQLFSCAVV